MTFGMGRSARALSSAFCKPSASVAPVTMLSKNSASALPSIWRLRWGTADASAPTLASFFSSAGVASPAAVRPTLTGINLCDTALSSAKDRMALMCAARRRGDANGVTAEWSVARPWAFRLAARPLANASPSFFNAFGGSSSTKSSTSRLRIVVIRRPFCRCCAPVAPALHLPTPWAPSESPVVRGCRDSFAPRPAKCCECGRCRRHARSR